jgi:translation initiation factor 3 subunit B
VRAQARVTILELPSREELRQKNLYNLHEACLHWHPQGDFLGVKVDRHTKTKKTIYTTFELFRVRDRNVAIEVRARRRGTARAWRVVCTHARGLGRTARPELTDSLTDGRTRSLERLTLSD